MFLFVVLYIVDCLCLDQFSVRDCAQDTDHPSCIAGLFFAGWFVVCVGGLCGKLVRAHGGCLGIESR